MNWLFEASGQVPPQFTEPKVDCMSCQVHTPLKRLEHFASESKCCQFSPFWSAFAIGSFLNQGGDEAYLLRLAKQGMIFTSLGILHPLEHRMQKKSLCQHFASDGGCHIWQSRPPICYSFFCSSQHADGLLVYGQVEKWLLQLEAQALKIWFFSWQESPESLWQQWGEYMEQNPRIKELPKELIIEDVAAASAIYQESFGALAEEPLKSFLQQEGEKWGKGLARHPVLC